MADYGLMSTKLLQAYVILQDIAHNNLYRIMGFALIFMSIYPFILKRVKVSKSTGFLLAFVGLLFLGRGFVDSSFAFADYLSIIFHYLGLPLAIVAFLLLIMAIVNVNREDIDEKIISDIQHHGSPSRVNHRDEYYHSKSNRGEYYPPRDNYYPRDEHYPPRDYHSPRNNPRYKEEHHPHDDEYYRR